jgi:hypothetical protein
MALLLADSSAFASSPQLVVLSEFGKGSFFPRHGDHMAEVFEAYECGHMIESAPRQINLFVG